MGRGLEGGAVHREEELGGCVELDGEAEQRALAGRGDDLQCDLVLNHDQHPAGAMLGLGEEATEDRCGDGVGQVSDEAVRGRDAEAHVLQRRVAGEELRRGEIENVALDETGVGVAGERARSGAGEAVVVLDGCQRAAELGEGESEGAVSGADLDQG